MVKLPKNELWWYGPTFLRENGSITNEVKNDGIHLEEIEDALTLINESVPNIKYGIGKIIKFENYSCLMKLLRIVVYCYRFLKICMKTNQDVTGEVSVEETEDALRQMIKWDQKKMLDDKEFNNMKKQLSLVYDENGILRLQGRLENSQLPFEAKHPILLDRHSYLTKLIILEAHKRVKHMRLKSTLNEVRSKYWICKGKQTVKAVIKNCTVCKYVTGKVMLGPNPPDLPSYRVSYEYAFSNVGIDYAGPLFVKDIYNVDSQMHKAYILLFTCAATRSVHLELCPNMSCSSLIRCLKRFTARRGKFDMAISDNFQTFLSKELKQFLTNEEIKWNHILAKSPWWGAFYERLIRIVKEALKKCIGKAKLTYEELETVLCEIEIVINSRPLTYLYEEVDEALTPSHLVIGRRLISVPMKGDAIVANHTTELLCNRYKYLQTVISHYWKRFSNEYLVQLHEHHFYTRGKSKYDELTKLLLNDVVLIRDDSLKINVWKKGKVEKLIHGVDGKIRGALLKVCHGGHTSYIQRPLQRIVPLEVQKENISRDDRISVVDDTNNNNIVDDEPSSDIVTKRKRVPPQRLQIKW